RFGNITGKRLFARQASERTASLLNRGDDLFDIFDARMIGAANPDGINRRIRSHLGDGAVDFRFADIQKGSKLCSFGSVFLVRAPNAAHISVTDSHKRLHVKPCIETTADDSNSEPVLTHLLLRADIRITASARTESGAAHTSRPLQ